MVYDHADKPDKSSVQHGFLADIPPAGISALPLIGYTHDAHSSVVKHARGGAKPFKPNWGKEQFKTYLNNLFRQLLKPVPSFTSTGEGRTS